MNDQDVRDMLHRRAADVTPATDAWQRIAERISGDEGGSVTELASRRRFLTPPALLGAAAAALLVLVATVALLPDRADDERVRAAEETSTTVPTPTTTAPALVGPTFEATAEEAARAWVQAIGAGDLDRAWDLLAEPSREYTRGRAAFEAGRTSLAESWGAWAGAEGVAYRTIAIPGLGSEEATDLPADIPRLAVVILSGSVAQEGRTEFGAVSLPVRGTVGSARVDPFTDVAIALEPGPAESGTHPRIPGATVLSAYTPAAAKVWFVLDDRAPVAPDDVEGADGDQQYVSITPAPVLSTGLHTVTVAALTVDGRVASRSTVYDVTPDASPAFLRCGMVGFTPNSEDAASDITVTTGSSCDAARAFVEVAGTRTSSGGPEQLDVEGYHCVRTESAEDPLPRSTYRCTRGTTVITFVRS